MTKAKWEQKTSDWEGTKTRSSLSIDIIINKYLWQPSRSQKLEPVCTSVGRLLEWLFFKLAKPAINKGKGVEGGRDDE